MHTNNTRRLGRPLIPAVTREHFCSIQRHLEYLSEQLRVKDGRHVGIEEMLNKIIALDPTALDAITPPTPNYDKSKIPDCTIFKINESR